jgi:hypothetical protein
VAQGMQSQGGAEPVASASAGRDMSEVPVTQRVLAEQIRLSTQLLQQCALSSVVGVTRSGIQCVSRS